jgi:saccharopine dehydrogenase-like NADP-dependent oxidoreductase
LADITKARAEEAIAELDDPGRFVAEQVDARNEADLVALIQRVNADIVINACDPRLNDPIFNAAYTAGCSYIDMAMNLSTPHPTNPYEEVGTPLGENQIASDEKWRERGILALV